MFRTVSTTASTTRRLTPPIPHTCVMNAEIFGSYDETATSLRKRGSVPFLAMRTPVFVALTPPRWQFFRLTWTTFACTTVVRFSIHYRPGQKFSLFRNFTVWSENLLNDLRMIRTWGCFHFVFSLWIFLRIGRISWWGVFELLKFCLTWSKSFCFFRSDASKAFFSVNFLHGAEYSPLWGTITRATLF